MAFMESRLTSSIKYAIRIFVMFAQIVTSVCKDFNFLMIQHHVIVLYCITLHYIVQFLSWTPD